MVLEVNHWQHPATAAPGPGEATGILDEPLFLQFAEPRAVRGLQPAQTFMRMSHTLKS